MEKSSSYPSGTLVKYVLNQCQEIILDDLSFDVTMDHMVTKLVFTDREIQDVKDEAKNSARVRALLNLIMKRGDTAYDAFISALLKTKQEHLRDKLKEVEEKVTRNKLEHAPVAEVGAANKKTDSRIEMPEIANAPENKVTIGSYEVSERTNSSQTEQNMTTTDNVDSTPGNILSQDGSFADIKTKVSPPLPSSKPDGKVLPDLLQN